MNTITAEKRMEYASFWRRLGAYLVDMIVVGIFSGFLSMVNITNYKSFAFYFIIAVTAMLYKPIMEAYYSATIGKMLLDLKVTDLNFNQIDLKRSLIRSLLFIIPGLLYIPFNYLAFRNPNLADANNIMTFAEGMTNEYPLFDLIGSLSFILVSLDLIFLLFDSSKRRKSLHDRLAETYVIVER